MMCCQWVQLFILALADTLLGEKSHVVLFSLDTITPVVCLGSIILIIVIVVITMMCLKIQCHGKTHMARDVVRVIIVAGFPY